MSREMRYQFIQEHQGQFRRSILFRMLGVSASAFYQWQKRPISQRAQQKQKLAAQVYELFRASKERYGSPRIHRDLQALEIRCSQKRVARLMKEQQLAVRRVRKFVVTTDSSHTLPVARNLLNRQYQVPSVAGLNRAWAGDITYIPTAQGWLYVAVVLDLKSRKVIGWSMRDSLEQTLVHERWRWPWATASPGKNRSHCSFTATEVANTPLTVIRSVSRNGASPAA